MASVSQQIDTLNTIFLGLGNKSLETRLQSALELRRYVATMVDEMSSDAAIKPWEDSINQRLFDLVHSPHSHDKLGGILAVDHLLDVHGEETIEFEHNLFRFYNYVKSLLPNEDLNIAGIGGAAFGEHLMDYEVPAAIGLLQGDKQELRYGGVLILKELARNSPVYFHSHIDLVFDKILVPIRDPHVIVREGAAELLAACLEIVAQKERQGRTAHLSKILADAQAGLKMSQPTEIIHGALLTYRELLLHGGMFMRENFMDTVESILRFGTSRDPFVRKMVITLIPTLAVYDTQTFGEHFLHGAMGHLLTLLDKSNDRESVFAAIGHVARAVGSDMIKPFLDSIMQQFGEDGGEAASIEW
ncbi:armadillo-type protein [Lactarius psammicola]|nr:armadillo-type protein [Lactarius psammicola]